MSDSDQLQPQDTLDDRGVDDILDEGISPPEKLRGATAKGVTPYEQQTGETIDDRLAQEEPEAPPQYGDEYGEDFDQQEDDPAPPGAVGEARSGRLVAPDQGLGQDLEKDLIAEDVGIDGSAASAEEAAMHITES